MTLHLGLSHGNRNAEHQQEIREARRLLKERVLDDWDYPVLPAHRDANSGPKVTRPKGVSVGGFKIHNAGQGGEPAGENTGLEVVIKEWRERGYASGSDMDGESLHDQASFRFESADSVAQEVAQRRQRHHQRRQQALVEEMRWNDGLAHWMSRRDVWSGARTQEQLLASDSSDVSASSMQGHQQTAATHAGSLTASRSSTSSSADSYVVETPSDPDAASGVVSSVPTSPDHSINDSSLLSPSMLAKPSSVLLPVASRILASHPTRKRISPSMYSDIYSKIIAQARTPSVPINLQDIISAMVKGWKDDGEWPPKGSAPEPSIGRKKKGAPGSESALKSSVKAVGRVLRLTSVGDSSNSKAG